ncbi:MAG: UMP kinase [Alphaproteobacteria bacterium]
MPEIAGYQRVLLKISGEALLGERSHGIDPKIINRLADEIATVHGRGIALGVVVGGGNIFRGIEFARSGGDRVTGDHMGMLATVMNALSLRSALVDRGLPCSVFSGLPVPTVCETFSQRAAMAAFDAGHVVIFAGGTGNPFFTTDTGAALRAAEMGCDALLKGTQVDGIYSADPKTASDAVRYDRLSYAEVLERDLRVMDAAAVAIARDNGIPIVVFSILEPGALVEVAGGNGLATVVTEG